MGNWFWIGAGLVVLLLVLWLLSGLLTAKEEQDKIDRVLDEDR